MNSSQIVYGTLSAQNPEKSCVPISILASIQSIGLSICQNNFFQVRALHFIQRPNITIRFTNGSDILHENSAVHRKLLQFVYPHVT